MKHSLRNWHNWVSVGLGFPLLLVGLTTFFIAHDDALGTKNIHLPISMPAEATEIRASVFMDGQQWLGSRYGLLSVKDGVADLVSSGPKDEVRDLAISGSALLIAGKEGLWRYENGESKKVFKGDCWQVSNNQGALSAACRKVGVVQSRDGTEWAKQNLSMSPELAQAAKQMPLSKVIMDIHTGQLFFGKQYEWIWIDLLGFACVGLGLTGLIMWMRGRRQRAQVG